jgi:hypothetical protein
MKKRKAFPVETSRRILVDACASMAVFIVPTTAGCNTHASGEVATTISTGGPIVTVNTEHHVRRVL